jgi:TonB family protein
MNPVRKILTTFLLSMFVAGAHAAETIDDVLSMLVSYERPAFPMALSATSITHGYATVALAIKADGVIGNATVVDASHDAFGDAVLQALTSWRFKSIKSNDANQVVQRRVLRVEFEQEAVVASLSSRDASKAAFVTGTHRRAVQTTAGR